ncbi:MAG: helix-turn-helix domain-containing protein [Clostridia bacterium]|nr:helix-turn-helix domain-containing protein [Clostridia bacterium]
MLAKLFQGILLELKDKVPFDIGAVDEGGNVVSCTDLRKIGDKIDAGGFFATGLENDRTGGMTFYRLGEFDDRAYALFATESSDLADIVCKVTAVAISNSKSLYDEKHDKQSFIKRILSDNILPGDIYIKSREMNFPAVDERIVYLISFREGQDVTVSEALASMFPDRQNDFIVTVNEKEIVLLKSFSGAGAPDPVKLGESIDQRLKKELGSGYTVGIGSGVSQLKDIARSYKDAQVAVEIGNVFDEGKTVINFESLGIGRLIYQLPTTLCEKFLDEVFKKGSIDSLDEETLFTIQSFFDNNLNVSVTSRKIFVHRNTLVYRLEKIRKLTGLDLREFDNAIVLKVALMVKKYLKSKERAN